VTGRAALGRIGVLMGAVFVDMMGFLMVLPLLPFYAERLGATPLLIGVLVAAHAFAQVATAPLWGRLSDRWGRRPVILLGLATSAVAYLLFGLAHAIWVLMLSRLVQGAGGGINGVIQAYVSDSVPVRERAKALGWLTAATSAGVMVGPVVGSLATRWGQEAPGFLAAALALVNVVFAWRLLPEPAVERHHGPARSLRLALLDVFRHPALPAHRMIWIYAAGMMAFMAMNGMLALYLERRFGVTERTIGYFYLYVGAISVLMRGGLLGPLIAWLGEVRVLQLGALALALGQALLPLPTSLLPLGLVIALVPIGTSMLFPATTSQLSRHAPAGHVGQTLGVQQAIGGVARMIGPIWAGATFQHLGLAWPFWLAAMLMLGALAIALGVSADGGNVETAQGVVADAAPPPT
jgi:multidrug resistance protein